MVRVLLSPFQTQLKTNSSVPLIKTTLINPFYCYFFSYFVLQSLPRKLFWNICSVSFYAGFKQAVVILYFYFRLFNLFFIFPSI